MSADLKPAGFSSSVKICAICGSILFIRLNQRFLKALKQFAVGKPVVIEETFPLTCTTQELEGFLRASREFACGWIGHYGGDPSEQLDALESAGPLSLGQAFYREWLRLFVRLKTEFVP